MKTHEKFIVIILLCFIAFDFIHSFNQYYHTPLDGDIAESVVPADWVHKVLNDPFALRVALHQDSYPNPNRFLCHWMLGNYLRYAPSALQIFVTPVDSVYLSCAIIKVAVHAGFVAIIALMISMLFHQRRRFNFLFSAVIITALFQTQGYNRYMGIIDQSVTYFFFYALPLLMLLLFYFPVYRFYISETRATLSLLEKLMMLVLAVFLPFSSPLVPAVAVIVNILLMSNYFMAGHNVMSRFLLTLLSLFTLLCLYSLYVGTFNSSNYNQDVPIIERYSRLPAGLFNLLTGKLGWLILLLTVLVNLLIIRHKMLNDTGRKIIQLGGWIGIFALLYILLLPLGGYRSYRSDIIRYDTFIPVTLSMIFLCGASTIVILNHFTGRTRMLYALLPLSLVIIFTVADVTKPNGFTEEYAALNQITAADSDTVNIECDCRIISWNKHDEASVTEMNSKLLHIWRIIPENKVYRHR